jgi:hypothetical protein
MLGHAGVNASAPPWLCPSAELTNRVSGSAPCRARPGHLATNARALLARRLRPRERMRRGQPSILDVVSAVKRIAPSHAAVSSWWYTPAKRLRLTGDRPRAAEHDGVVEIAVQCHDATALDPDAIARELSRALDGASVRVRAYRGAREDAHLFRLLSGGP